MAPPSSPSKPPSWTDYTRARRLIASGPPASLVVPSDAGAAEDPPAPRTPASLSLCASGRNLQPVRPLTVAPPPPHARRRGGRLSYNPPPCPASEHASRSRNVVRTSSARATRDACANRV